MPPGNNLLARIRVINTCLGSSNKKYWSKRELINRISLSADINISERTLDGDIQKMRHSSQLKYNAPIKFSKYHGGYFYENPDYSIDKLPINEKDIQALEFATTTLSQYKKIKILEDFVGTVDKLINVVNLLKYTQHETQFAFIDFEKAPYSKGTEHLNVLVDAIKNKKAIEILYQKFDALETKSYVVCPYLLKEYRNRWYLLGHSKKRKTVSPFGLDRIIEIKLLENEAFISPQNFSAAAYFKNTIGINYKNRIPSKVELSFSHKQGYYIKTQHLHETQEILVDTSKELRIRMYVVINYELISMILSFGDGVKVLKPLSLKNEMIKISKSKLKLYRK